jgi:anti-sigma B factor antagonist
VSLDIQTTEKSAGVHVVRLTGRLDTATSGRLEHALTELFRSPVRGVQLDLSDLEYCSSMGLRAVMIGMKRANKEGATLVLVNPRPHVKKVLDIANVLPEGSILGSIEEADAQFEAIRPHASDEGAD